MEEVLRITEEEAHMEAEEDTDKKRTGIKARFFTFCENLFYGQYFF